MCITPFCHITCANEVRLLYDVCRDEVGEYFDADLAEYMQELLID